MGDDRINRNYQIARRVTERNWGKKESPGIQPRLGSAEMLFGRAAPTLASRIRRKA